MRGSILKGHGQRYSMDQRKQLQFNVQDSPLTPKTLDYRKNSGLRNTKEVRRSSKNVDLAIDQINQMQLEKLSYISDQVPIWQIPVRIFIGLIFAFDIATDINLAFEVKKFSDETSHFLSMITVIVIYWVIGGICTTLLTRNKEIPYDQPSEKLGLIFKIFAFFGLDIIFYYFYSGITKNLSSEYEEYCNQANSSRKIWGTVQSILSSFICAHYIFTKPLEHSDWAIAGLILSMTNAGITLFVTLNQTDFKLWLKECIFSLRCLSIIPEVIGRPLFFGVTTLVLIDDSSFLGEQNSYKLTYDFLCWDAIALVIVCGFLLIVDMVRGLGFAKAFAFIPLIYTNTLIQRPPADLEVFKVEGLIQKYILGISDLKAKDRSYHTKLHFIFPLIWRLCEYLAFLIVMQNLELLSRAEKYKVENLAYNALIWNLINCTMILVCLVLTIRAKDEINEEEKMSKTEQGLMNQIEFARKQSLLPNIPVKKYQYRQSTLSNNDINTGIKPKNFQRLQKSSSLQNTHIRQDKIVLKPLDQELVENIQRCDSSRKQKDCITEQDEDQIQTIENNSQGSQKVMRRQSKDVLDSIGLEIPQNIKIPEINYNPSQQQFHQNIRIK